MPKKAELIEQAEAAGIEVPSKATKADIEALLAEAGPAVDVGAAEDAAVAFRDVCLDGQEAGQEAFLERYPETKTSDPDARYAAQKGASAADRLVRAAKAGAAAADEFVAAVKGLG